MADVVLRPARPLAAVRSASCGCCGRQPGIPCTPEGDHLARWLRAERLEMVTRAELAAAIAPLDVIAANVIILGGEALW